MAFSGYDNRRPTGLGYPHWGSVRYSEGTVSHHAWGRLLVLPLGLMGISRVRGGPVDIGVGSGRGAATASLLAWVGRPCCWWTEEFGYCEHAFPPPLS
jgi:hypothetical protein